MCKTCVPQLSVLCGTLLYCFGLECSQLQGLIFFSIRRYRILWKLCLVLIFVWVTAQKWEFVTRTWKGIVRDIRWLLLQHRHVIFPWIEDNQSAVVLLWCPCLATSCCIRAYLGMRVSRKTEKKLSVLCQWNL